MALPNVQKRALLFDLEATLIEDWYRPDLLQYNMPYLLDWMKQQHTFDYYGILSYAIHNPADHLRFMTELCVPLEQVLGIKLNLSWVLGKRDMLFLMRKNTTLGKLTMEEFDDFLHDKDATLARLAMKGAFKDVSVTLIDDQVSDSHLYVAAHNTTIQTINVSSLKGCTTPQP